MTTMGHSKPEFCFVSRHIEEIGLNSTYLMNGEPYPEQEWPKDAHFFMSEQDAGMELSDMIGNTLSLLIVSSRLKAGIEQGRCGRLQFLPVALYNHKKRLASSDYFIVNPIGVHDVLDLEASDIEYHEGQVVTVRKFVIDARKAKDAPDILRPREDHYAYILSSRILDEWKKLDPPRTNTTGKKLEVTHQDE